MKHMSNTDKKDSQDFKAHATKLKAEDQLKELEANKKHNEKLKPNLVQELLNKVKSGKAPQLAKAKSTKSNPANDTPIYVNILEYERLIEEGLYGSVTHQWQQALDIIVNNLNADYSFTKNQINEIILPLCQEGWITRDHPAYDVWCRETKSKGYKQDLMEVWTKYAQWAFGETKCVSIQDEQKNQEKLEITPSYKPKNELGKFELFSYDSNVNEHFVAPC